MVYRIECPRCGRTGFVRSERVFTRGVAFTTYFCGVCTYHWQERDEDAEAPVAPPDDKKKPRRMRRS